MAAFSDRSATGSVARLPMLPSDSHAVALTHLIISTRQAAFYRQVTGAK